MGWLYVAGQDGKAKMVNGKDQIVRCNCQYHLDVERRRRRLEAIDGLKASERGYLFANAYVDDNNEQVLRQVQELVDRRRGLITLYGKPGAGKTHILMCAVNEARERHVPAVYTTVTDVLDYLRNAYHPQAELTFDARWDTLTNCEVLALDELSEFNTTSWALERFLRLMDERWRQMDRVLTLCATNGRLNNLPEKVASRLSDRRATVIEMAGVDMRKVVG
jgi:DNA replication protein DnaC